MNEYLIYKIVKNNCNDFDITEELSKGVLRPYFKDFIEFILNFFRGFLLFSNHFFTCNFTIKCFALFFV